VIYLYRSYRFGVHFAREVLTRFLLLPCDAPNSAMAAPQEKGGEAQDTS
jgi:hypothetical protein